MKVEGGGVERNRAFIERCVKRAILTEAQEIEAECVDMSDEEKEKKLREYGGKLLTDFSAMSTYGGDVVINIFFTNLDRIPDYGGGLGGGIVVGMPIDTRTHTCSATVDLNVDTYCWANSSVYCESRGGLQYDEEAMTKWLREAFLSRKKLAGGIFSFA